MNRSLVAGQARSDEVGFALLLKVLHTAGPTHRRGELPDEAG